jgi:hypothetical protein
MRRRLGCPTACCAGSAAAVSPLKFTFKEKEHFIGSIGKYKDRKIPFIGPLVMLQSWAVRFEPGLCEESDHFWAFPEDLIELCAESQCEWAGEELFI